MISFRVAPDPSVKLYREGSTPDRHWIKVIGGRGHGVAHSWPVPRKLP